MPKVLITGANGFIGSHLVEEAIQQGLDVFAGVRQSSNLEYLKDKSLKLIELNLLSQKDLEKEFKYFKQHHHAFDYVIHNAGITYAPAMEDFLTVNYDGTRNLVNALQAAEVPLKKFILISSLAARGPGISATSGAIKISDAPAPVSSYGKSKLLAEQFVRTASLFPHIIFNPTAVYGPRDKDFLALMKMINYGLEFYIGRDRQVLSLIYVKDLARAVVLALKSNIENCSYLISDGVDYNKEDLGSVIRNALKRKTVTLNLPTPLVRPFVASTEWIGSLFGKRPFLNMEKLNEMTSPHWKCQTDEVWRDLNTSAEYSLERGVEETVAWYKQNAWLK